MAIGSTTDRKQHTTVWLVQGFLSMAFLITGVMKLTMPQEWLAAIMTWPGKMPVQFVRLIGFAAMAGGGVMLIWG